MSIDYKKYLGATGDALVYAWQRFKSTGETEPPVGSQDKVGGNGSAPPPSTVGTIGGISMGTLLMAGLAWMLLRR